MADHADPETAQRRAGSLEAEGLQVAQSPSTSEISPPMLDVPAPHEGIQTWRAFFIHIATIVVGLLIALGLEQSVEHLHHERQVAEIRKSLQLELALNIDRFAAETELSHRFVPILRTNLAVFGYLHQHPGASAAQWPGALDWSRFDPIFWTDAWDTAKQSGVLTYMPESELRHYAAIYRRLDTLRDSIAARRNAMLRATEYAAAQPDASLLSPSQIDEQVALIRSALGAYGETAVMQRSMADQIHEFSVAPTQADIEAITHLPQNAESAKAIHAIVDKFLSRERNLSNSELPR